MNESVLDRLTKVHPDMEIWWDSSPLIFKSWVKKMVDAAPKGKKALYDEWLNRIYVLDEPAKSLIRGCTTNPPLSLTAVKNDTAFWNEWIDNAIKTNPGLTVHEYFWLTYKEVIRRGAEMMLPIWEASGGRYGYISGQLDPRLITETEKMIVDAQEIRAIAPNLMIKVPASTQGVEVVKALSSMAIPTNVTTCFTLPQIWAVANAAKEGMEIGLKNKVDMSNWRAVITMMIGRLTENPVLDEQAARRNIKLSWSDKHWLGIYVFRKAFKLLKDNGLPSKMLACSMREGPLVGGKFHFWDVEKIAGDIVYTMPPYVLEPLFQRCEDMTFSEEILLDDVPPGVLAKLSQIPYVRQSWDENGMEVDQFNAHPATIATAETFSKASIGLEEYVAERVKIVSGEKVAA
ncbi:MAG: transaldolase family protein [Anaerolineales bacterium]|nr:transaldolase family protein [Anaerolineales bacterium]